MSWLSRCRPELSWIELHFDRRLELADAERLILALLGSRQAPIVFEAEHVQGRIQYRLGASRAQVVSNVVRESLPHVVVVSTSRQISKQGSAWRLHTRTSRRMMAVDDPEGSSSRLLGSITVDGAIHQLVIGKRLAPRTVTSDAEYDSSSLLGAAAELVLGRRKLDAEQRRAWSAKRGQLAAEVSVRVLVPGEPGRAVRSIERYAASLRALATPGQRLSLRTESYARAAKAALGKTVSLNVGEILCLVAWPFGERSYPHVDRSGSRLRPLPPTSDMPQTRTIGSGLHPASPGPVGVSAPDGLRHTWLLGPTGVGKSTVLEHLILSDIQAGRGVVVVDPKGDLVDNVLARLDRRAIGRVRILDPSRSDFLLGFNPLVGSGQVELRVDNMLYVQHSLNRDSWGPRTQDILHASLLTLARSEQPTLVLLPQLLTDRNFRRACTSGLSPTLASFWGWFEALSEAERASVIAPVLNKTRPFTMRTGLRTMLGQTEGLLDMRRVFTDKEVVLVPLKRGHVGAETANLVGALVLAGLWQAAQAQAHLAPDQRSTVFAYLDEFQDYLALPTSLSDVLAQARGLGLGLVLAHQHLAQLTPSLGAAVSANAQNQIAFRLGADDASVLARSTPMLEAQDFQQLGAFQAYARLMRDGDQHDFGSLRTYPPMTAMRKADELADVLAERDGCRPAEVDDQLFGPTAQSLGDIGERPRRMGGVA